MIDVNWDLAPEGAEELVQFESHVTWRKGIKIWCMVQQGWCDYVSDFKTIATRPTQKAVADAVEPHFKATRENLEKIAKDAQGDFVEVEQEGEKWTHEWGGGKCRIIATDESKDEAWVKFESTGNNGIVVLSRLKPIKPTISESDVRALQLFANKSHRHGVAWAVKEYLDGHDVI